MKKTLIIAEAGVNHNGKIHLAKELAKKAKEAGADIVKYQTFVPELLVSRYALKAEYQQKNDPKAENQLDMLKRLCLTKKEFIELKAYCNDIGITFLSTPFDLESIKFLEELDIPLWKIPSGEIENLPYLEKLGKTGKPVIMSTGMASLEEIRSALKVLKENGTREISLLHCTTQYPAPMDSVNLRAMETLGKEFGVHVGYSDHTEGIEVAVAAVSLGAQIIEKHFTLDKTMEGPDHIASLEPTELKKMVCAIRNIEKAMGSDKKEAAGCEIKNIGVARKSIVALKDIKKGEILDEFNLTVKRPGNGISPMRWYEVVGKTATRDFKEDEMIEI